MPLAVIEFQETPNPHALKCVLSGDRAAGEAGAVGGGLRSYRQAPATGPTTSTNNVTHSDDPVAKALFSIRGVTGLLIAPYPHNWVTVSKNPETPWANLKPALKAAFATLDSIAAATPQSGG